MSFANPDCPESAQELETREGHGAEPWKMVHTRTPQHTAQSRQVGLTTEPDPIPWVQDTTQTAQHAGEGTM